MAPATFSFLISMLLASILLFSGNGRLGNNVGLWKTGLQENCLRELISDVIYQDGSASVMRKSGHHENMTASCFFREFGLPPELCETNSQLWKLV
jgi:hypothetical protein